MGEFFRRLIQKVYPRLLQNFGKICFEIRKLRMVKKEVNKNFDLQLGKWSFFSGFNFLGFSLLEECEGRFIKCDKKLLRCDFRFVN